MNSSVSVLPKDNFILGGPKKLSKRNRKRAKWYNYYLKRRRFRKLNDAKKANSSQLSNFYDTSNTEQIMSHWYWYNYNKSLEWQDRHQLAHWKATALALLEENRYLLEIIKNMQPGMIPETSISQSNLRKVSNSNKSEYKKRPSENAYNHGISTYNYNLEREGEEEEGDEEDEENERCEEDVEDEEDEEDVEDVEDVEDEEYDNENSEDDDSDFELEMSKEMIQFFEQSQKRKMELEKLKEKEIEEKTEKEIKEIKSSKIKRTSEMNLLYGEGASMITGMETAVQLGFNKYCDNKSPKFWPNIPFRL